MKFLALSFLAAPAFACDTGDTLVRKETSQRSSSCVVYGYCYGWNGHGNEWGYGYKMCNGSRVDKVVTEICAKPDGTNYEGAEDVTRGSCRSR
jgi:hypothetical protein